MGRGLNADSVGVPVHPSAGAIVVTDGVGGIKGKFGGQFPLGHGS